MHTAQGLHAACRLHFGFWLFLLRPWLPIHIHLKWHRERFTVELPVTQCFSNELTLLNYKGPDVHANPNP